jgi:hypothetical protein
MADVSIEEQKAIVNRLKRAQGQLAAVITAVENNYANQNTQKSFHFYTISNKSRIFNLFQKHSPLKTWYLT